VISIEKVVVSKMETTAADGKNYNTNIYNLDGEPMRVLLLKSVKKCC
jgi:hypothetical protein